jgi:hypothetical protein
MNIKNMHFYIHITCSMEVFDGTTVEFVKSTEYPPNSWDSNPLDYHVHNKQRQLVYKNWTEPFQSLDFLQQRTENVWCPISLHNIQNSLQPKEKACSKFNTKNGGRIKCWLR